MTNKDYPYGKNAVGCAMREFEKDGQDIDSMLEKDDREYTGKILSLKEIKKAQLGGIRTQEEFDMLLEMTYAHPRENAEKIRTSLEDDGEKLGF